MHELGLCAEVVAIVRAELSDAPVARVKLEVGKASCVSPDALRFAFDLACEGTPLAGARLEIEETPGRARCPDCGRQSEHDQPFGVCECGNVALEWLSGDALRIIEVELRPARRAEGG